MTSVALGRHLAGKDASGFDFALSPRGIRHTHDRHGDQAAEAAHGQRAVTVQDYAKVPGLLNSVAQTAYEGLWRETRSPLVSYQSEIDGELMTAVFAVLGTPTTGRRMLELQTLHIQEAKKKALAASL